MRFERERSLSERFYRAVLAPAIEVGHAAALIGHGSGVLGYDTERSTDHDWGPRAVVFVDAASVERVGSRVAAALPDSFGGWAVRVGRDGRVPRPDVQVTTLAEWFAASVGLSLDRRLSTLDWLLTPQQRLLEVTSGAVFRDDHGDLTRMRELLAWYPDDVWWWMLASQWQHIGQEEPFVQRTAEAGDEIGSRVVTARQIRECMRLALLIDRRYAPYAKWLGTAFGQLPDRGDDLTDFLRRAVSSEGRNEREHHLSSAYVALARRFNELGPKSAADASLRSFHDRPARVLGAERFVEAALGEVRDADLLGAPLIGAVDQFVDSTDVLTSPTTWRRVRAVYGLSTRA